MIKKDDISIVVNARVNSTRVFHKIIRPFGNTTLLDICLRKISEINEIDKYLACCENEILNILSNYKSIKHLNRSKESVEKGFNKHTITFKHYSKIQTPYIMVINPCLPFVKTETYYKIIDSFINGNYVTYTSIKKCHNIYFDSNLKPINFTGSISTVDNGTVYALAHVFHIFNKKQFVENGSFWDYSLNNPGFFVIEDGIQTLDVDKEIDFEICEELYLKNKNYVF